MSDGQIEGTILAFGTVITFAGACLMKLLISVFPVALIFNFACRPKEKVVVQEVEKIVEVRVIVQPSTSLESRFSEFESSTGRTERFQTILTQYQCRIEQDAVNGCILPIDFVELDYMWETLKNLELALYNNAEYKDKDYKPLAQSIYRVLGEIEVSHVYAAELNRVKAEESAVGDALGWEINHVVSVGLLKRARALKNLQSLARDPELLLRANKVKAAIFVYKAYSVTSTSPDGVHLGYDVGAQSIIEQIEAIRRQ